ncbi:MAG: hypothetical protein H6630_00035 [Arcobacter sp.]|nr:hypothetical protein [Arcobacter sp.]
MKKEEENEGEEENKKKETISPKKNIYEGVNESPPEKHQRQAQNIFPSLESLPSGKDINKLMTEGEKNIV